MTDRAIVVIDHGYLAKALEADFAKAKIDYLTFSNELCSDLGFSREATWLYDGRPKNTNNPTPGYSNAYSNKIKFFQALARLPNFEVKLGKTVTFTDDSGRTRTKQKGVDIRLALDIVVRSTDKSRTFNKILLITGDSDIEPAVELVVRSGVDVILCPSDGNGSGRKNYADSLKDACSGCHFIDDSLVKRCLWTKK
jgi:uncharacterized LabA/DUF88 family protein